MRALFVCLGILVLTLSCAPALKRQYKPNKFELRAALVHSKAKAPREFHQNEDCQLAPNNDLHAFCVADSNAMCTKIVDPDIRALCNRSCKSIVDSDLRAFCVFSNRTDLKSLKDCEVFMNAPRYMSICIGWVQQSDAMLKAREERLGGEGGGGEQPAGGEEPAEACKSNGAEANANQECCSGATKPKRCSDPGLSCGYVCCSGGDGCN